MIISLAIVLISVVQLLLCVALVLVIPVIARIVLSEPLSKVKVER